MRFLANLLQIATKVQELLELQDKTSRALAKLDEEVRGLRRDLDAHVARVQAREEVVIANAQGAAAAAAVAGTNAATADLARRLGQIEGQIAMLGGGRALPPPG